METPAKRRLSEVQSAFKSPPTKRRTSFFLPSASRLSLTAIDLNNDEEERKELRRTSEFTDLQKRRDSLKSPAIDVSKKIASMYSQVIKLSMENKITQKNTWNLNLIDHMKDILIPNGHSEETNFQKASCTLDASVKIYGCRVDDTLTTSFRVLENLSRNDPHQEQDETIVKHTSRKLGVTNTIESNPKSLIMDSYDLQFDIDPLFHKMSQKFDEGGVKGMLLNNLHVHNGCRILLDSSETAESQIQSDSQLNTKENENESETITEDIPQLFDCNQFICLFPNLSLPNENVHICPKLSTLFEEIDAFDTQDYAPQISPVNDSESDLNINEENKILSNSQFFEDLQLEDISIHENEDNREETNNDIFDMPNTFEENYSSLSPSLEGTTNIDSKTTSLPINNQSNIVSSLEDHIMSSDASLYTFVPDAILNSLWNGPKHWKLNTKTNKQVVKKVPKVRSIPQYIDFLSMDIIDVKVTFAPPTKETDICIVNKSDEDTLFTLPEDQHINSETFISLFLRPEIHLRRSITTQSIHDILPTSLTESIELPKEDDAPTTETQIMDLRKSNETQIEVGNYIYDNQLDSSFVNNLSYNDNNDNNENNDNDNNDNNDNVNNDIPDMIDNDEFDPKENTQGLRLGSLIDSGRRKFDTAINYATVSKKVNVQELKNTIWSCVDHDIEQQTSHSTSLVNSITTLKGDLEKDVTAPFYFICLLHLANEHNLELENGNNDFTDIIIKQDKNT